MVILLDLSLTSNSLGGTTHLLQSPGFSLGGQGCLFSIDRPSGSLPVSGQEGPIPRKISQQGSGMHPPTAAPFPGPGISSSSSPCIPMRWLRKRCLKQRGVCPAQSHTVRGTGVPEPAAPSSCFLKD